MLLETCVIFCRFIIISLYTRIYAIEDLEVQY
jgi:hypothetical protein